MHDNVESLMAIVFDDRNAALAGLEALRQLDREANLTASPSFHSRLDQRRTWKWPNSGHGTRQLWRFDLRQTASTRDAAFTVGEETITIFRFQNVAVRLIANDTGSPSVPALAG